MGVIRFDPCHCGITAEAYAIFSKEYSVLTGFYQADKVLLGLSTVFSVKTPSLFVSYGKEAFCPLEAHMD